MPNLPSFDLFLSDATRNWSDHLVRPHPFAHDAVKRRGVCGLAPTDVVYELAGSTQAEDSAKLVRPPRSRRMPTGPLIMVTASVEWNECDQQQVPCRPWGFARFTLPKG
jgi:hypothetical protein